MKPALVVLAAGASARLGTCKALVEFRGESVLAHHLRAGASLDEVPALIVTGQHHEAILSAAPSACEVVFNPDWLAGRTGGLALAQKHRSDRALLIAPVDVPLVPRSVFEALTRAWLEAGSPERGWLAPRYSGSTRESQGRFGHPIVIGPTLASELAGFAPDQALRQLRQRAEPLLGIDTECEEILFDLDTPADLEAIRKRFP